MDCDLQDRPEEIRRLHLKAKEGFDVVLGRRRRRKDSFIKRVNSRVFYSILSYLTDTKQDGTVANFGIYRRKVIDAVIKNRERTRYLPVMVRAAGFKTTAIDIQHGDRDFGESSYTLGKLMAMSLDIMLAFSYKPLRLTIKLGLMMSIISFLYAFYMFINALSRHTVVQGWASIFVSLWFLSGLNIFTLGMVGVYVGKTFEESKRKPLYIIKDKTYR